MVIPGVNTWAAGSVLTAAQLNTFVSNVTTFFLNRPTCQVRQTLAQSFTSGSSAACLFDSEDIDNDGMHSTVSNTSRLTGQTAGRFVISGGTSYATNTSGFRDAEWNVNGSAVNGAGALIPPVTGASTRVAARSLSVFLNVGDFVELLGLQNSGGPLNSDVAGTAQPLALARWVGTT